MYVGLILGDDVHPVQHAQQHYLPSDTLYLQMPKGEFVRFQPHTSNFIDLAAALGPRVRAVWHTTFVPSYDIASLWSTSEHPIVIPQELMEHAMKNYSALSVGEVISIECSGERFQLTVLEIKPDDVPAICLYGDLDLEVDFAPAMVCALPAHCSIAHFRKHHHHHRALLCPYTRLPGYT